MAKLKGNDGGERGKGGIVVKEEFAVAGTAGKAAKKRREAGGSGGAVGDGLARRPRRLCALLCAQRLKGNSELVGQVDIFAEPDVKIVREVLNMCGEGMGDRRVVVVKREPGEDGADKGGDGRKEGARRWRGFRSSKAGEVHSLLDPCAVTKRLDPYNLVASDAEGQQSEQTNDSTSLPHEPPVSSPLDLEQPAKENSREAFNQPPKQKPNVISAACNGGINPNDSDNDGSVPAEPLRSCTTGLDAGKGITVRLRRMLAQESLPQQKGTVDDSVQRLDDSQDQHTSKGLATKRQRKCTAPSSHVLADGNTEAGARSPPTAATPVAPDAELPLVLPSAARGTRPCVSFASTGRPC
ncbi:unnamed protein product [Ostreobium quekettii]|uniref:Uncharacterized protein n=1 Tax=Ostreobium quekettii TaxID=121088 RepID=A0A8S1J696_9CHLO|nr:unnamed protein product [Ostreobium quekettii]